MFKTKNGRAVYDGGGIKPDVAMPVKNYSKIAISLESKLLIFDFATSYRLKHNNIAKPKEFKLTDAEYDEFVASISDKSYDYTTKTEKLLTDLKKTAEAEKYYLPASAEYDALKAKMMHNKKDDLKTFKKEIKELLEVEIISRYYYQKGETEYMLTIDDEVKRAIEILKNKDLYSSILTGKYKDPEIKDEKTENTIRPKKSSEEDETDLENDGN